MEDGSDNHSIWYIVNVEGVVYRPEDSLYLMMVRARAIFFIKKAFMHRV